jgi:exosome complex component RRP46
MRGVVCAVAIGRLRPESSAASKMKEAMILVLDPSDNELPFLEGGGCFAFLFAAGLGDVEESKPNAERSVPCEVVWSNWHATTTFDEDELVRARELARVGAERVWRKMKESVDWMGTSFRPPLVKDAMSP